MKACPLCGANVPKFDRRLKAVDLLRCGSCAFVYADLADGLILEANSRFGRQSTDTYESTQTVLDDLWFRRIARAFTKRVGPGRVLDIGCGNGRLLGQFQALNWECCGLDPSPWSREFAQKYGFRLYQGLLEDLGSALGEFDLVVSSSTLEHVAQPVAHVRALVQIMKQDGYAYFCGMPNYASLAVRFGFSSFYMNTPPEHVNFFTPATLRKLFQFAGVPVQSVAVRTYGLPELHRPYNAVTRLLRRRCGPATPAQAVSGPAPTAVHLGGVRETLLTGTLAAFYHLGRIAAAGDKLEATIRR